MPKGRVVRSFKRRRLKGVRTVDLFMTVEETIREKFIALAPAEPFGEILKQLVLAQENWRKKGIVTLLPMTNDDSAFKAPQ